MIGKVKENCYCIFIVSCLCPHYFYTMWCFEMMMNAFYLFGSIVHTFCTLVLSDNLCACNDAKPSRAHPHKSPLRGTALRPSAGDIKISLGPVTPLRALWLLAGGRAAVRAVGRRAPAGPVVHPGAGAPGRHAAAVAAPRAHHSPAGMYLHRTLTLLPPIRLTSPDNWYIGAFISVAHEACMSSTFRVLWPA